MSEVFDLIRHQLENFSPMESVTPLDIIGLRDPLRMVLNRAFRTGQVTLAELAEGLNVELSEAETVAGLLVEKGFLKVSPEGTKTYEAYYSGKARGFSGRLSSL